ncbi:MAG: YfgM family protein [Candidatus Wenzhouxiangella sp. M2_3B_020]
MAVELYDEHEQSERVRNWLRENGVSIFLGVALALAGIFGWRQWQDYRAEQTMLANEYYSAIQQELEADDLQSADEQFQAMREGVDGHSYVVLAGMLIAAARTENGEIEQAASIYRELLDGDAPAALQPVIRLRIALLETGRGRSEEALAMLDGAPPVGYEGLWLETRGDVLFDLGRLEEAGAAYAAAVDQLRGAGRNFRQARLKLDAVRSASGMAEAS